LVELVFDRGNRQTALAIGSSAGVVIEKALDFGGTKLVPWNAESDLIKHEALVLAERPDTFTSTPDLCGEIDRHLLKYIELPEDFRKLIAAYVLLTWVYDAFNELPYLRFRGDLGSGKTRALTVTGSLCNRAFFASGASTDSPIFHTLNAFKGTLVLDEADFRFSDEKAELSKILNNGNVRGYPVLRTMITPQKDLDPRAFSVYGPKIIAMRGRFEDSALESRFITIEMEANVFGHRIAANLPDQHVEDARALRNKLLGFRFAKRLGVSVDDSLYDLALTPRANQVTLPLLSLIDDPSVHRIVKEIVTETHKDTLADRAASPAGALVALIIEIVGKDDRRSIPLGALTSLFIERSGRDIERPITNRYVGALLRNSLSIHPYKSHGTYHVPLMPERIALLAERFGLGG
jgi:hypothetical protein